MVGQLTAYSCFKVRELFFAETKKVGEVHDMS